MGAPRFTFEIMNRRRFLSAAPLVMLSLSAAAHTPYRQWQVLRERFLLIHTSKSDEGSDVLGERIAAALEQTLPEARAMVARTPDEIRIASLMRTGQARVAVLSQQNAVAMSKGAAPFADIGKVEMQLLAAFGEYLWVCRPDLPEHHSYLLASAVSEHKELGATFPTRAAASAFELHAGVAAFVRGDAVPAPK